MPGLYELDNPEKSAIDSLFFARVMAQGEANRLRRPVTISQDDSTGISRKLETISVSE